MLTPQTYRTAHGLGKVFSIFFFSLRCILSFDTILSGAANVMCTQPGSTGSCFYGFHRHRLKTKNQKHKHGMQTLEKEGDRERGGGASCRYVCHVVSLLCVPLAQCGLVCSIAQLTARYNLVCVCEPGLRQQLI